MDIFVVPDDDGNYVPVIGLTLSQIEAVLEMMYNRHPEPLYSIQSLFAEGQVVDNMANLTIQLRIQTQNEPLIRVPIGLKSGIFSAPEQGDDPNRLVSYEYDGPSQFDIIASPQGEGYEIILRTMPQQQAETADGISAAITEPITESPTEPDDDPAPEEDADDLSTDSPADSAFVTVAKTTSVSYRNADAENGQTSEPGTQRHVHTVTLRMSFPVSQPSANEYLLKAEFPPALNSHLQLVVPLADAIVLQTKGGSLRQNVPFDERSTLLEFRNVQDDFEIQWHEKQHTKVRERVVLQVENGNIVARLSPTGVVFDATIPVQSSGGTFDSFYLRLPRGAVFRPTPAAETAEYQIEEQPQEQAETSDEPAQAALQSQVLLFRLARPTEGPVHVRVQAETPAGHSQNGWFELGGFDLLGAEKQFGNLSVVVSRETRLHQQNESRGIRPAGQAVVTETEGVVSSFEYYEQPCSLMAQAVPQAPRVHLRPEYQVEIVNRNHAVLRAKLSYTIHGGQNRLAVNMNGWQLTDIGPDNLVNRDELPFMESGPVTFSLLEPVGKRIDLTLRAERSFDSADEEIRFSFPVPEADVVEPAFAAVIPADNIELKIDENMPPADMTVKPRRNTPLEIELPLRQQGAMIYQVDHPVRAEFRAKPIIRPQKISVQSQTELSLHTDTQVVQTLQYTVDYEPVSRLILGVPAELDDRDELRVLFESRSLTLFDLSDPPDRGDVPEGMTLKQVLLPDAKIGSFQLTANFRLPPGPSGGGTSGMQPNTTTQVIVPILLPYDGELQQETVQVRYPREILLNHDAETTGWVKLESPSLTTGTSPRLTNTYRTKNPSHLLQLGASLKNAEPPGGAVVEKGWIRCWLLGAGRFDCACYQVTTRQSRCVVTLPEYLRGDKVAVNVDNRKVEAERKGRVLSIPLDTNENDRPRTIEIWYEVSMPASRNSFSLELPTFSADTTVRPVYCQVILPSSRHLLACGQNWMPQFQWRFAEGCFSRKSDLGQKELEEWVGVSPGDPVSPDLNSYLFVSFRPAAGVDLDVADRSTLVLVSSGLILLIGLVFIYFPRTRYPGVVFTSVVLFASFFAYRVTLAIVFLQAGVIGFLLVLLASFLYRLFVSNDAWKKTPAKQIGDSGATGHTPVFPLEEEHSDFARVRVARSDAGHADSRDSDDGTQIYSARDADIALPQDASHPPASPAGENDRGSHA